MIWIVILIIVCAIFVFVFGNVNKGNKKGERNPIKGRRLISMNEQPTFLRLREALPEHIVLAQVAFSAFMTAKGYATRNLFNRKVADFVVLDKQFNVVAIVELDDSSHKGKEAKDAERDALISEAGYRLIRYQRTPDLDQVKKDFGGGSSSISIATSITLAKTDFVSDAFVTETESTEQKGI
ncbi:DUF2726 domain-containing protein [Acinetobacter sp. NIPH 1852]|uniref:DUF2726 domain-containing protein n=1 Tax=Acinetobacter sp. NIPH 1852 TaxID=2923428 RepID=UPI001F4ACE13|nr:DUF2726 domain-containing protein [Acinetobacter sp. NIPH 1852]MCH7308649.1 DUF2726 domain-containing protein [Acinetobacter sp. NIPH 1852]